MFSINTILVWNINIILNKKYDNNNIIIASRAYFLHEEEEAPTSSRHQLFSGTIAGEEEEDFCEGSFHMHILYFILSFALLYFYLHRFIKNPKKLESFVVVYYVYFSCYYYVAQGYDFHF
jgi:hypothetical protein